MTDPICEWFEYNIKREKLQKVDDSQNTEENARQGDCDMYACHSRRISCSTAANMGSNRFKLAFECGTLSENADELI